MGVKLVVSRMDPLDSYDPAALAAQLSQHLSDAQRFEKDSQEFAAAAQRERRKADEVQKLITKVNERRKQRGNTK